MKEKLWHNIITYTQIFCVGVYGMYGVMKMWRKERQQRTTVCLPVCAWTGEKKRVFMYCVYVKDAWV